MNPGFEDGTFNGWMGSTGTTSSCCSTSGLINGRHTIVGPGSGSDPIGGFPKVRPGGFHSVRLGNSSGGANAESLSYSFNVDPNNPSYIYHYAVVLQNPGHTSTDQPKFIAEMFDDQGVLIPCSRFEVSAGNNILGFQNGTGGTIFKPWSSNYIPLDEYAGQLVTIRFTTYDCSLGGHYGYAYIDGECLGKVIDITGVNCLDRGFSSNAIGIYENENFTWNFGDGTPLSSEISPTHTYANPGTYTITLTINNESEGSCSQVHTEAVVVESCEQPCIACITPVIPLPGDYVISAWVKEEFLTNADYRKTTYVNPQIILSATGSPTLTFTPSGEIIDGWQRIEGVFKLVTQANISVTLKSLMGNVFFDDIRLFPFDGSMMSYVYDPISLRLLAELDERNYAKFYEYDEEGKLVRVKKETEKGIMTIQENRENSSGN